MPDQNVAPLQFKAVNDFSGAVIQRAALPIANKVVSGHGRFNENYLEDDPAVRRGKLAHFVVPPNMSVILYTPDGAALDDGLANRIEKGNVPAKGDVELVLPTGKAVPLDPWPLEMGPGTSVINYTVTPPDGLNVMGQPIQVQHPKSLYQIVLGQADPNHHVKVHYAACGAGFSDKKGFRDLFPARGSYVRLK